MIKTNLISIKSIYIIGMKSEAYSSIQGEYIFWKKLMGIMQEFQLILI